MKFGTARMDLRNYFRVLQEYTFALRLAGGTSSDEQEVFYVGGVNNPVNPRFSTASTNVDPNRVGFSSFVWPLRGVELFDLAGDSFVLANVAFRFPLLHQLAMGWPLPFFFQNVQGELFLDVGSAFNRDGFKSVGISGRRFRTSGPQGGLRTGCTGESGHFPLPIRSGLADRFRSDLQSPCSTSLSM